MEKKGTLKGFQILHKAMFVGQIIFAVIAVFIRYNNIFPPSLARQDNLLQVIAIAISFAGFFIGSTLFRKRITEARDSLNTAKEKAIVYHSASIIQWALLEAPILLCIIFFLLVGNYAFIALAAALMVWFFLTGPSKMRIMLLLRLSEKEMEQF